MNQEHLQSREYFTKYTRRHELARFMVQYELFKKVLNVKGSIVECGVYTGGGVLAWAKISDILEPYNFLRKIYGFDTFEGFPSISPIDNFGEMAKNVSKVGYLKLDYNVKEDIEKCIEKYNSERLLYHQEKIHLIKGDANETIPNFLDNNPHVLVSLLYLDFDIYTPTLTAIKNFISKMPKGAIIAFDELNDAKFPGETSALLECLDINKYNIEHFPWEPHISWLTIN
jgi:hypothetical protein